MSKAFWQPYSIKPQTPDSLVKKIRSGRKDVSGMTPAELETHMAGEANLRAQLAAATGKPKILPTQAAIDTELGVLPANNVPAQPADATRVRRKKNG